MSYDKMHSCKKKIKKVCLWPNVYFKCLKNTTCYQMQVSKAKEVCVYGQICICETWKRCLWPIHLWKQRFSNDQMYKIYRNWKLHAWIFSLTHTLIKWTESLIVLKGKHVENCTMYTLRTNISRLCVPCWSLHFYSSSSFMRSSSPPILYNLRVHRKWRISYLCCQESKT